nr:hypothetical protein [Tanacetum cinerariifolium]
MNYPRFTKVIIDYFMTRKPSISRRNTIHWHYVPDDALFSTIKVAYKEYYACATKEAAPKPKASARKKRGGSASSTTPLTPIATLTPTNTIVAAPRLSATTKGKQPARATSPTDPSDVERTEAEQLKIVLRRSRHEMHISLQGGSGTDEGTGSKPGVLDDEVPKIDEQETTESGEGANEETESDRESEEEETTEKEEESFDPIPRTPEECEDDGNGMESIFTTGLSTVTPIPSPQSIMTPSIISTFTTASQLPIPPTPNPSLDLQNLPTFAKCRRPSEAVQTQTDRLQDSIQRENDEFLKTIDDNMKKIIKEQVKTQVKAQVTRILPRIEESMNTQLEAEVLKRSDEQRNLYKALVEAYDADKTILDTYGESAILKRRRKEDDDQEGPSAGSDRGLRLQDIEDMLLLLVQGKLSNLTVEERFAFNVSLRMFTRSIVIQRRMEDLKLGVESYQKRLNLTKPDTYQSDLKRREAYTAYSNPRGFIYQNKDKKNRLMRIDELYKFSNGTLNDVRNALDDRLKGIRMQYLPTTIWRRGDKDRAAAMIQEINKMLKTKRIMRSLERFVGGRQYEGDFRMLQRTI